MRSKSLEKESILDTSGRWTWLRKGVADELGIPVTQIPRTGRTADGRLVEGFLAGQPLQIVLDGLGVRLWMTPIIADWLAGDLIIGNDFMDKAGIRLVGERAENYRPIGELYSS